MAVFNQRGFRMRKIIVILLSLLALFVVVAGANGGCANCDYGCDCEGVVITFEDTTCGETIGTQYNGVTFEPAMSGSASNGNKVAEFTETTTISFFPEVSCVSFKHSSYAGTQATAYDNQGNVVDTASGGNLFIPEIIELASNGDSCISYITITYQETGYAEFAWIDNLKFCTCQREEIPEFPTIAIPMLAIIGLALVMQRRRE
ncbi:MAG: hypothetical protein PWQ51_969 [Methanolobus sp.]|nr:hypothetical protein [Methanolobus sp.]MDK2832607.1 hypothetical protein [Methanolobus sp.]MDK2938805.1 hypothetical protein [Methanolobus sp.]